ncbi:hypothetical protein J2T55_002211 [Methylohalomonas lacus]|uniref:Formate dehydrogenase n=1 Tax=Methylohalomonas lacus TaxID=398773 RepID=A0AAE3HKT5_9GAMM|nr:formate dehydrogenase [Methylohalomonas lacus]MCS3904176.1 hypothetical protein [Methylohalomonas lacus]
MSKHDQTTPNRRRFFGRVATVFGAIGAAAVLRPQSGKDTAPAAETPAPAEKRGYAETAHVRKYYDKARF